MSTALRHARYRRAPELPDTFTDSVMRRALAAGQRVARRALPYVALLPVAGLLAMATAGAVSARKPLRAAEVAPAPPPLALYQSAAVEPRSPEAGP